MHKIGDEFLIYYPSTKWRIIKEDIDSFIFADVANDNSISVLNKNNKLGYLRRKIDKLDFCIALRDKIAQKV